MNPIYSPLFDKLKYPTGNFDLFPLKGSLGVSAKNALETINRFTKTQHGFSVRKLCNYLFLTFAFEIHNCCNQVIVNNSYIKEGSSGTMHLTCECYGSSGSRAEEVDNDALVSSTKKKRNTPSKKCGCPYDIKIYVVGVPTTLRRDIETILFDTGVCIYEYPKVAHTCCCQTVQRFRRRCIQQKFRDIRKSR